MNKVNILLKDRALVRWSMLILLASMMFFAYMFVDVLSPLKSMLETTRGWTSENFGTVTGSEYFLNVFALFLIFAGIILDKMGVRFTAILSALVMLAGAAIKYYALTDAFIGSGLETWLNSWWVSLPASAKLASLGFMIFGCGVEMAGVTVSKGIVKWFKGKELALAMGVEMAIARLGVFAVFRISPRIAESTANVSTPVLLCMILLIIGLLAFTVYFFFDRNLEKQMGESGEEPEEEFKVSDLGKLFTSKAFLLVSGLCVLYYSAIFPFQKFAANMLECRLQISATDASDIFSWFPIGAMLLTPLLGAYLDNKGKGASMLIIGAVLMCLCHLTFALVPEAYFTRGVAYTAIIILGISFSLVPAALWPSVPKLVANRYLGSAYSVIFWIQNMGLWALPLLVGTVLDRTNRGVTNPLDYDYTVPMLIFASLGVLAFILGLWLKAEDRAKGYGLELPNITKKIKK
ncbi:MAG TPA: MFS transporter [Bacteroidales bacterium]|nr:MAG: Major Facilitator Superfamily protein [Bacteroidetes bacterium ADurb.Bin139]HOG24726.1 MFS transporter [Bacteroidales bacterium]HOR11950.1 MFS transporter [Bacteroidales bacterium]